MQSAEHRQQEVLVELDVSWKHPQDWRWRLPLHAAQQFVAGQVRHRFDGRQVEAPAAQLGIVGGCEHRHALCKVGGRILHSLPIAGVHLAKGWYERDPDADVSGHQPAAAGPVLYAAVFADLDLHSRGVPRGQFSRVGEHRPVDDDLRHCAVGLARRTSSTVLMARSRTAHILVSPLIGAVAMSPLGPAMNH